MAVLRAVAAIKLPSPALRRALRPQQPDKSMRGGEDEPRWHEAVAARKQALTSDVNAGQLLS